MARFDRTDREVSQMSKAKLKQQKWQERKDRSKLSRDEISELQLQCADLRQELQDREEGGESEKKEVEYTTFAQLPISQRTQMGLERGHYTQLTPIQKESMHLALAGFDVLGAAKTGSGKTLCFVIPVLEKLFREHWSSDMGVGALILSPTRELALQIFKVMQVVGYKHVVSAALLTGGRDVEEEKKRLHAISVIVGTPGRVLHHFQDNADLVLDNMQLFCMDEADRLLDLGFREALTSILTYLPPQRQTLLYSATQTTDVKMLAQMALKDPRYVSTQQLSASPTPATLCQNFVVVELHRKLDVLLMFLKRHPNDKIVVFASTCNQVKFMYLAFSKILKKMRIPSMCLTSKMKQFRREEVFLTFCRCKSAVLFCTDVAARGLDFPLVHWVVQYDCPDSAQTYIHRAGRTARAGARGVSLLFLSPQETPMLSYLHHKNVPLREIAIKSEFSTSSQEIFVALVVQGLKYEAQKAFVAYLRSVYFAANKNVFDVSSIDVEAFAKSLGLLVVPDMSTLNYQRRSAKNLPWDMVNYLSERGRGGDDDATAPKAAQTRKEKHLQASDMFRLMEQKQKFAAKTGAFGSSSSRSGSSDKGDDSAEDEDAFLVKKPSTKAPGADEKPALHLTAEERLAGVSKSKRRRLIEAADLRVRDLGLNQHIIFRDDDDDEEEQANGGNRASSSSGDEDQGFVTGRIRGAMIQRSSDDDDDDGGEETSDEGHFTSRLQERVSATKTDDGERAKKMRRLRRLQKQGRVSRKTTINDSGVTTANGGPGPRSVDEDADGTDYDDDDVSSTGSLSRLIKAAKGELYSEDDDDEGAGQDYLNDKESGDEDYEYHGIDSEEDNGSDESEEEAPQPQKKRQRR